MGAPFGTDGVTQARVSERKTNVKAPFECERSGSSFTEVRVHPLHPCWATAGVAPRTAASLPGLADADLTVGEPALPVPDSEDLYEARRDPIDDAVLAKHDLADLGPVDLREYSPHLGELSEWTDRIEETTRPFCCGAWILFDNKQRRLCGPTNGTRRPDNASFQRRSRARTCARALE